MKKTIPTLVLGGLLSTACSTPEIFKSSVSTTTKKTTQSQLPKTWQAPYKSGKTQQQLTSLFKTASLQAIVQKALANNLDLQQTALRLKEQGLLNKQTRAAQLPTINSNISHTRAGGNNLSSTTQYNLGVSASWEIDLWGKLADQTQANRYELKATHTDYEVAKRSLVAQVMRHWVSLATQQQIIAIEQQRIRNLQRTANSRQTHFESGNSNLAAWLAAKSNITRTQANLLQRKETLQATKRTLNILLGQTPQQSLQLPQHLPSIRVSITHIPSEVISQRLDIQAAFLRLQAADKTTQIAYKQLLPTISLTPSISSNQNRLSQLLSGDLALQFLSQLSGTLWDGGQKHLNAQIQRSTTQRAALTYQQTLLNALLDVEDKLGQENSYTQQLKALTQTLQQVKQSQQVYQTQYQQGTASLGDLVSAQNTTFDTHISFLETQRNQLENRINLALALGLGI